MIYLYTAVSVFVWGLITGLIRVWGGENTLKWGIPHVIAVITLFGPLVILWSGLTPMILAVLVGSYILWFFGDRFGRLIAVRTRFRGET